MVWIRARHHIFDLFHFPVQLNIWTYPCGGMTDCLRTSAAVPGRVKSIDCRTWLLNSLEQIFCRYSGEIWKQQNRGDKSASQNLTSNSNCALPDMHSKHAIKTTTCIWSTSTYKKSLMTWEMFYVHWLNWDVHVICVFCYSPVCPELLLLTSLRDQLLFLSDCDSHSEKNIRAHHQISCFLWITLLWFESLMTVWLHLLVQF